MIIYLLNIHEKYCCEPQKSWVLNYNTNYMKKKKEKEKVSAYLFLTFHKLFHIKLLAKCPCF